MVGKLGVASDDGCEKEPVFWRCGGLEALSPVEELVDAVGIIAADAFSASLILASEALVEMNGCARAGPAVETAGKAGKSAAEMGGETGDGAEIMLVSE